MDLGLNVQLGHPIGERCCRLRGIAKGEFVIVHSNGIHVINLAFCGCETAETYSRQLLRYHWLPVTADRPRTAATFQVLEEFHLLSLDSKLFCYEFYTSLACRSDNTGLLLPKVRHHLLLLLCMLSHVRLVTSNFCVWCTNGAILKCLNVRDGATTLPVFQIPKKVNVRCYAPHVPSLART